MIRMKDVAQKAGVSVATVSNVITGKHYVSPQVRSNVLKTIGEMNYKINLVARGLKTQRTYTIGVILPDITKMFFPDVLKGIMDRSAKTGYKISILSSNYDFEAEQSYIEFLKKSCVDGIILDSCVSMDRAKDWAKEMTQDPNGSPPIVSIENIMDQSMVSSILIDYKAMSKQLTQHLIVLGKKRIMFIAGPLSLEHGFARFEGYKEALMQNSMPVLEELIAYGDYSSSTAYSKVQEALSNELRFDAIQASNDQSAIGALKALKEADIPVPEAVAVCGFDNLFPSTLVNPQITTVDVPRYELGARAFDEVLRRIEKKEAVPSSTILDTSLIIRSSTDPHASGLWNLDNW